MTLSGNIIGDRVIIEKKGIEELHVKSFYGRPRGDDLEISLTEGAYLINLNKISVVADGEELGFREFFLKASLKLKNFDLLYLVYKDLRERGYYAQPSVTGFRVYPRGGYPGRTPAEYLVHVTSERKPLPAVDLIKNLETAENLKKRLIMAIVDEDSDITYYEGKNSNLTGSYTLKKDRTLSVASFVEDRVVVWDPETCDILHNEGFFGKLLDQKHLLLSLVEAGYLLINGILEIEESNNGKIDFNDFSKIASSIESDFMMKYAVYERLRNDGIVPKTGFKFGTHFRVYKEFESLSTISHSDYLIHAISHDYIFLLQQLSRAVRLANSVRKEMIYAMVSSKIDLINIKRIRL